VPGPDIEPPFISTTTRTTGNWGVSIEPPSYSPRRVVRPRTMFSRRTVLWQWTTCAGDERWVLPWCDKDGHAICIGDPPPDAHCIAAAADDFTCPVHPRRPTIIMGETADA
jgi:hypothetical protein